MEFQGPVIKKEPLDSERNQSPCETLDDFLRSALWPKAVKRDVLVLREMEEQGGAKRVCHALTYTLKFVQMSGDVDFKTENPADLAVSSTLGSSGELVCEVCGTQHVCQAALQLHMEVHAGEIQNQPDPCGKGSSQSRRPAKASGCRKQARTQTKDGKPSQGSEHRASPSERERQDQLPLQLRAQKRPEGKYVCKLCGVKYVRRQNLKSHMRIHTGETPYRCDVCGRGFRRSDWLLLHANTHRGDQRNKKKQRFPCNLCDKIYQSVDGLRNHVRTHTGERPFACQICGEAFYNTSCLNIHHLNRHSEHRPHECSVCGRGFKRSGTLNKHMRIHTGEKPFSCGHCRKTFRYKYSLTLHERHCCED